MLSARSLTRSPGFIVVAVLTVALGIASATALFTIVNGALIHPLPYKDADRLVVSGDIVLAADFRDIKAQNRVFKQMALYESRQVVLSKRGQGRLLQSAAVSRGFLPMLSAVPVRGRSFTENEYAPGNDNIALISYALWRKSFYLDPHILGTSIVLDSKLFTIIGVLPRWFHFKNRWFRSDTDVWVPLALTPFTTGAARCSKMDSKWLRRTPMTQLSWRS